MKIVLLIFLNILINLTKSETIACDSSVATSNPGCTSCTVAQGTVCAACDTEKGFTGKPDATDSNKCKCSQPNFEYDATEDKCVDKSTSNACDPSVATSNPGCTSCTVAQGTVCAACDTEKGFTGKPDATDSNKCKCSQPNFEYDATEDKCVDKSTSNACDPSVATSNPGCTSCTVAQGTVCAACDTEKGFTGKPDATDSNKCKCSQPNFEYDATEDKCVDKSTSNACDPSVATSNPGCTSCTVAQGTVCAACDTEKGFTGKPDATDSNKCKCSQPNFEYDATEDKCVDKSTSNACDPSVATSNPGCTSCTVAQGTVCAACDTEKGFTGKPDATDSNKCKCSQPNFEYDATEDKCVDKSTSNACDPSVATSNPGCTSCTVAQGTVCAACDTEKGFTGKPDATDSNKCKCSQPNFEYDATEDKCVDKSTSNACDPSVATSNPGCTSCTVAQGTVCAACDTEKGFTGKPDATDSNKCKCSQPNFEYDATEDKCVDKSTSNACDPSVATSNPGCTSCTVAQGTVCAACDTEKGFTGKPDATDSNKCKCSQPNFEYDATEDKCVDKSTSNACDPSVATSNPGCTSCTVAQGTVCAACDTEKGFTGKPDATDSNKCKCSQPNFEYDATEDKCVDKSTSNACDPSVATSNPGCTSCTVAQGTVCAACDTEKGFTGKPDATDSNKCKCSQPNFEYDATEDKCVDKSTSNACDPSVATSNPGCTSCTVAQGTVCAACDTEKGFTGKPDATDSNKCKCSQPNFEYDATEDKCVDKSTSNACDPSVATSNPGCTSCTVAQGTVCAACDTEKGFTGKPDATDSNKCKCSQPNFEYDATEDKCVDKSTSNACDPSVATSNPGCTSCTVAQGTVCAACDTEKGFTGKPDATDSNKCKCSQPNFEYDATEDKCVDKSTSNACDPSVATSNPGCTSCTVAQGTVCAACDTEKGFTGKPDATDSNKCKCSQPNFEYDATEDKCVDKSTSNACDPSVATSNPGCTSCTVAQGTVCAACDTEKGFTGKPDATDSNKCKCSQPNFEYDATEDKCVDKSTSNACDPSVATSNPGCTSCTVAQGTVCAACDTEKGFTGKPDATDSNKCKCSQPNFEYDATEDKCVDKSTSNACDPSVATSNPGCTSCTVAQGTVCAACDTEKGFTGKPDATDSNKCKCSQPNFEYDATEDKCVDKSTSNACDPSVATSNPGCTSCTVAQGTVCAACDTEKGFTGKPDATDSNKCKCSQPNFEYDATEDKCVDKSTSNACDPSVATSNPGCTSCTVAQGTVCAACDTEKGFTGKPDATDSNKCKCSQPNFEYDATEDKCVDKSTSNACDPSVATSNPGCTSCTVAQGTVCAACDTEKGFTGKPDATDSNKCKCSQPNFEYDATEDKCVDKSTSNACDPSVATSNPGCTSCTVAQGTVCAACDTEKGFTGKPDATDSNKCKCSQPNFEYDATEDKCVDKSTSNACDPSVATSNPGCTSCTVAQGTVCAACDTEKGFTGEPDATDSNKCKCSQPNFEYDATEDKCVDNSKPNKCEIDASMEHCTACIFNINDAKVKECTTCDSEQYQVSSDKTKCIPIIQIEIVGNAVVGQKLKYSTTPNNIAGGQASYQWKQSDQNGEYIAFSPDQTGSELPLTSTVVGKTIIVTVKGDGINYASTPVDSKPTSAVSWPELKVTISGTPKQGETLTANTNPADIPAGQVTYQWNEATVGGTYTKIESANEKTFVLGEAQVDKTITVTVTGDGQNYEKVDVISPPTAVIVNTEGKPKIAVTIDGTAKQGQTLTAMVVPNDASVSYDWKSAGEDGKYTSFVPPKTDKTLFLDSSLIGKTITVTVKATGETANTYDTAEVISQATAKVEALPKLTVSITGKAEIGQVLTATLNQADAKVQYNWTKQDGDKYVPFSPEETKATLELKDESLVDKFVKVTIIGDGINYDEEPVVSKEFGPITNPQGPSSESEISESPENPESVNSQESPENPESVNSQESPEIPESSNAEDPNACLKITYCEKCDQKNPTLCAACSSGYELSSDRLSCQISDPDLCKSLVSNCAECNSTQCIRCEQNYGLKGGLCTQCPSGVYSDGSKPCPAECTIDNCSSCILENNILYCEYCDEGFKESDDKRSCIAMQCSDIYGCTKCNDKMECIECNENEHFVLNQNKGYCECAENYTGDINTLKCVPVVECGESVANCSTCTTPDRCLYCSNMGFYGLNNGKCELCEEGTYQGPYLPCLKCDSSKHEKPSSVNPGTCVCDNDYDYIDGKCVEAIQPELPPSFPTGENVAQLSCKEAGAVCEIKTDNLPDKKEAYVLDADKLSGVTSIVIPPTGKDVHISIPETPSDFTVNTTSNNIPVTVYCPDNAKIKIPASNDITLSPKGNLQVNSIEEGKDVVIKKLIPAVGSVTLTSDSNVTINELDVFGVRELSGESDNNKETKVENARLARGATFTPNNMNIQNIEVGLLSKVLLKQTPEKLHIGRFIVDYNRAQYSNIPVPIQFSNNVPYLNQTALEMKKTDADSTLQEEEVYKVADFEVAGSKEQCENLLNNYDKEGDSGFSKSNMKCEETENGKVQLVARKEVGGGKKDKGLSGGAIAGIVIACVVVVAAIIALLVYFLVIKKRNHSTTSTQGDSSIAI